MEYIFKLLLALHITGGSAGLIAGTISIIRKKGDNPGQRIGILFLGGMFTTELPWKVRHFLGVF